MEIEWDAQRPQMVGVIALALLELEYARERRISLEGNEWVW